MSYSKLETEAKEFVKLVLENNKKEEQRKKVMEAMNTLSQNCNRSKCIKGKCFFMFNGSCWLKQAPRKWQRNKKLTENERIYLKAGIEEWNAKYIIRLREENEKLNQKGIYDKLVCIDELETKEMYLQRNDFNPDFFEWMEMDIAYPIETLLKTGEIVEIRANERGFVS